MVALSNLQLVSEVVIKDLPTVADRVTASPPKPRRSRSWPSIAHPLSDHRDGHDKHHRVAWAREGASRRTRG
jgi:hypothetical protein